MALQDLTDPASVLAAIDECDALGEEAFLAKYRFDPAREYFLIHQQRWYPSKAIAGAAHGYQHGRPLRSGEFSGGAATVQPTLEQLGFEVRHSPPWDLTPGETIRRTRLHERYGGRRQGGVAPSRQTPNVMLFSDAATGEQHGYHDRWHDNGTFDYVGEGQHGDQALISGNKAIAQHREDRRALRVFQGARGEVAYVGEFVVDSDDPYHIDRAPETGGGPERNVLVFHLIPTDTAHRPDRASEPDKGSTNRVEVVPVEAHTTESFLQNPSREPVEAERREQRLVHAYRDHLEAQGHEVCRHLYRPVAGGAPMACDVYNMTTRTLVEAKASVRRESIRMAIGQLLDYRRLEVGPVDRLEVLLPREPGSDLLELLHSVDILATWPAADSFETSEPDPAQQPAANPLR